jgi:hypothetical protein
MKPSPGGVGGEDMYRPINRYPGNRGYMAKGGRVQYYGGGGVPTYLDPNTVAYSNPNDPILQHLYQSVLPQDNPLNRLAFPFENGSQPQPFTLPGSNPTAIKKVALPVNNQGSGQPSNPWANNPFSDLKPTAPGTQDLGLGQADMTNPDQQSNINFNNPADNPSLGGSMRGLRPGKSGSAMDWMGMLPGIFNLGAGLMSGKAQRLNPNQFQNPYEQQALAGMPSQFNINPQLNEAKNAYANYTRNVNNQGNSRGERMANYGAGMNQYNANIGQAYAEKNNKENMMAIRRSMMQNEQGQQRAGVNMNIQNINDQNAAAARNNRMAYLGAGMSDLQKNYLVNKQMGNQQTSQNAYIRALMNMPHFQQWLGLDPNNLLGVQNNTGK